VLLFLLFVRSVVMVKKEPSAHTACDQTDDDAEEEFFHLD
jgi:hypothetical protein